jgi:hypothetical protein
MKKILLKIEDETEDSIVVAPLPTANVIRPLSFFFLGFTNHNTIYFNFFTTLSI